MFFKFATKLQQILHICKLSVIFSQKIEFILLFFMYEDGFGCLHTKDIFGHKMKVYPFAKK